MNTRSLFIVTLNPVDYLTLGGLLMACGGLLAALHGYLSLAVALMLIAMVLDMFDGALARASRRGPSEFGRYLDSFGDVFIYLLLPLFVLYRFGMQDPVSLGAFFIFLTCGVLRLARFNMIGTVEEGGVKYYLGLPVFWSQLIVTLAFPLWRWLGDFARGPLVLVLVGVSGLMIANRRFIKPTRYGMQAVLIVTCAALYLALHALGVIRP